MRRTRRRGPSDVVVGLLVLGLLAVGVVLAQRKELPLRDRTELRVAFRDVNGLKKGSQVRLAGVTIGKVVGIDAADGPDAAVVTLRLERAGLPIHRDATFKVRPRLFLEGNFFVDVRPGTPRTPLLADGDTVPVTQTSTPVQFDRVLSALDSDTRSDLGVVLDEYGRALDGGAAAVNRTYRYTRRAYRYSAEAADAQLGSRAGTLGRLVRDSGRTAAAIDADPRALQALIVGLHRTARGFAVERDELDAALAELPRTLRVGLPTLAALNRAFPPLRRFVADLRPALRTSVPALDATLPLARQLRALVQPAELRGLARDLRAATPDLVEANRTGVPLGEQVRLGASCNNEVLIPWSQEKVPDAAFPAKVPIYAEGARALTGLAGESRSGDANGSWFRTLLTAGNASYPVGGGRILTTALPITGVNPPAPATRPPLERDVPCETQERPDLRTTPGDPPARLRIDAGSPAAIARTAAAQADAVAWLRKQVRREGLADRFRVTATPLTRAQLPEAGR